MTQGKQQQKKSEGRRPRPWARSRVGCVPPTTLHHPQLPTQPGWSADEEISPGISDKFYVLPCHLSGRIGWAGLGRRARAPRAGFRRGALGRALLYTLWGGRTGALAPLLLSSPRPSPPHRPATKVSSFRKRGLTWATGSGGEPLRACSLVCLEIERFGWAVEISRGTTTASQAQPRRGRAFTLRSDSCGSLHRVQPSIRVCITTVGEQTTFSPSLVEADYETWGGGSQVDIL